MLNIQMSEILLNYHTVFSLSKYYIMTFITETTCIPKTLYEKLMKAFRPENKENSQRDHRLDYALDDTLEDTLDYTLAEDEEYAQDGMAEPDQYKYVVKTL